MGALIQCPHCKQLFGLSDQQVPQYAGQTISCSQCKQAFTVPANLSQQAAQPQPAEPPSPTPEPSPAPQSQPAPQPEPPAHAAPARVEKPVVAPRKPVEPPPARPIAPQPAPPPPPRPARISPGGSHHGSPSPAAHRATHARDSHHGLHVPPPVYPSASPQAPSRAPSVDYPAVAVRRQAGINKLAVASVVCGAVGLIPIVIPSIAGLIVGIMGLRKSNDPLVGGRKIALTGIFISALSFVLLFGWLAIVIPQVNKRSEEANRVRCQANLKAIGQAVLAYTAQYGAYPPHLEELMISQKLGADLFVCPSSDDSPAPGTDVKTQAQSLSSGAHLSYSYVGQRLNAGASGPRVVILFEPTANHDHAGSNFLFADGHVDWLTASQAEQAIPQIQNGINPPKY